MRGRKQRARRSHEIDLPHMVRRAEIPEEEVEHLEKFAAAAPNAERQRHRRNEKRADGPGEETKLFSRKEQTDARAAAGQTAMMTPASQQAGN